jgi:peptidoglycan/xylan/chitin deacetylase (PgdA/CDA1 family)
MLFTTSWDDGHPLDLRLAELLNRHGFRGTFYVPSTNREGRPVLPLSSLRQLDALGEVGSHTLNHCYLTTVNDATARRQVHDGRTTLQNALGHSVNGFCYPGGRFRPGQRGLVKSAGFKYARTTKNLTLDVGADCFERPTTLQFYPHSRAVYLSDWIRYRQWHQRMAVATRACASTDLLMLLKAVLLHARKTEGTFHLWGHSWELDSFSGWAILEEFLIFAADHVAMCERVTNEQALA